MAEIQNPREIHTKINYFKDTGEPLVPMVIGGPEPPKPQSKIPWPVTITDVTGNEDKYTLENQGFQYIQHKSCLEDFDDDETIKRLHYPEMKELVTKVILETENLPKPSSVHILTHIIRRGPPDEKTDLPVIGPLYGVHVDQSFAAAEGVIRKFMGDNADELLQKPRFQIINTWRPIRAVTRTPFAVCDAKSVPDSDLIHVPIIFPDHNTEALEVRPPTDQPHRWYFKQNQQPDDVLFFKQVDSDERDCTPRRVPHCAFNDPNLPQGAGKPRISIEVRALVFYDSVEPL